MNLSHFIYNLLVTSTAPVLVPLMWLHQRSGHGHPDQLHHRLGFYSQSLSAAQKERPKIWLHAASVGEVGVAVAVALALRQAQWQGQIVLSTTTEQGLAQAMRRLGQDVPCFFAPLDWLWPVKRALEMVRPNVLAILETEIWPNLLACAHRFGVSTAIINGRISGRSFKKYDRIKSLMRFVLSQVDAFSMISEADAGRVLALGAPPERVVVHGSAKFDVSDPDNFDRERQWAQHLFGIAADLPVFVAGSTRDPEEDTILDAFIRIRNHDSRMILIIAPRHIQRCEQIVARVRARGLACQLRTQIDGYDQKRSAPVVVVDTIGELFAIYSVARFVFCGGSLVPKGGQNLLEPALWGKPIMYGPSMEDFAHARELIEGVGGGIRVDSGDQIVQSAIRWLRNPEEARIAGQAARNAVLPHRGAARKHARVLLDLLNKSA